MREGYPLKQVRNKLHLTQNDLAKQLGISWRAVQKIEYRTQALPVQLALQIQRITDVKAASLLEGEVALDIKGRVYEGRIPSLTLRDEDRTKLVQTVLATVKQNLEAERDLLALLHKASHIDVALKQQLPTQKELAVFRRNSQNA
jgi:DNA-binding XRE family transcriptional regulator